jgi:hypothetical protein
MYAESRILERLSDGGQTVTVNAPGRNEIGRIGDLLGGAEQRNVRGASSHRCAGSSADRDMRGRTHAFELG